VKMMATRRQMMMGALAAGAGLALARTGAFAQDTAAPATAVTLGEGEAVWPMYNLNLATEEQLLAVPGVDEKMLDEFMEYRPYTTVGQFIEEIAKYTDEETAQAYFDWVFVPVDVTALDADTLMQLPGVDEDKAATLAAGSYADGDAFLAALAEHVSAQQVTMAAGYLADRATAVAEWVMLNLNSASEEQFAAIPGMTERWQDEFAEYGPYASIEQFSEEIGKYDEDALAVFLDYVFVPVAVNDAAAEDLLQIPGIDEDDAQTLIDARPYADNAAFLAKLAELESPEYAAAAAGYLA